MIDLFRSTPPHGGRPATGARRGRRTRFRSTPPHGGRPTRVRSCRPRLDVSIHAPARGATIAAVRRARQPGVFRSTPPHGGRPGVCGTVRRPHWFRSTPPHGGRRGFVDRAVPRRAVSIHAPARGATNGRVVVDINHTFRSTPPHGGRRFGYGLAARRRRFDPRPRTGGDVLRQHEAAKADHGFDPRPRTGGDTMPSRPSILMLLFRSTPPHGGRPVIGAAS